jgi:hypothetical protein
MWQKLDDAIGYKKCFETYFNRNINYKDSSGNTQTVVGPEPFEMQKFFKNKQFFPWIVQDDITT